MAGISIWKTDPAHSSVEFAVKHMMMTTVRGKFTRFTASLEFNEDNPNESTATVEIEAASLETGVADRDTHLRSADFFDVEKYPKITFRSKRVTGAFDKEGDEFKLVGDLTIRDTTTEVTLDAVYEGKGTDPWGKLRAGFSVSGDIDRRDWGLKWNQVIETGGVLVANKVKMQAEAQFVQESAEAGTAKQTEAHP